MHVPLPHTRWQVMVMCSTSSLISLYMYMYRMPTLLVLVKLADMLWEYDSYLLAYRYLQAFPITQNATVHTCIYTYTSASKLTCNLLYTCTVLLTGKFTHMRRLPVGDPHVPSDIGTRTRRLVHYFGRRQCWRRAAEVEQRRRARSNDGGDAMTEKR